MKEHHFTLVMVAVTAIMVGPLGWVAHEKYGPKLRDLTSSPLTFVEDRCTEMAARHGLTLEWTEISEEDSLYLVKGRASGYPEVICSFNKQGFLVAARAWRDAAHQSLDLAAF
jgi:hypothetical protein